jgi:hypothetical protein
MATRGFENFTEEDVRRLGAGDSTPKKPSKYRNVRCETPDGVKFDSRRERDYYLHLKTLERLGEIKDVHHHDERCRFWLMAPSVDRRSYNIVSSYIADFTYLDAKDMLHVVDAKGKRTAVYQLKKKWLELQEGVVIEEV